MFDRAMYRRLREYHGHFTSFTLATHPLLFVTVASIIGFIVGWNIAP